MDSIKVARVERVLCTRPKGSSYGTLHLTAHHLIFAFEEDDGVPEEEMWVPYPLISLVTRQPLTLHGFAPVAFRTRAFETFTLTFARDRDAADVFESIKLLTVITRVDQLYAFDYKPNPPFESTDGWNLFNPRDEFARMGLGTRSKAWRFTDVNKDYNFCPTYPARLVVPARISDTTLTYAAKYRSKARIPALVYLHWANRASITRSSQPMVGLTNNRSIQDEKLIEAIFQSHLSADSPFASTGSLSPSASQTLDDPRVRRGHVYGATATNLIIDARPTTNAMVMSVKGAGTENMEYYKDGKKAYLGVDNIHVMRESLSKVADALRDADQMASLYGKEAPPEGGFLDRQALRKSGWLKHISAILDGTLIIVKNIHINSSHVLIHCSDGWDRTAQLSSLSQLCLDPFYRTFRGFQILIEKDWLGFGHRFADRCGHLSSEKFFTTSTGDAQVGGGNAEAAHAFLASMQNKFTPQSHIKETSPVFHQFLECVRQIQRQYPSRFEFNEGWLERLHYHLYSCQFGTFLWNNERERRTSEPGVGLPTDRTYSVWDFFNSANQKPQFMNPDYDSSLDDRTSRLPNADMGVLLPNPKDVRFWHELYGRTDEEMNGRLVTSQAVGVEVIGPVEGTDGDPVQEAASAISNVPLPPSPIPSPAPPASPGRPLPSSIPTRSQTQPGPPMNTGGGGTSGSASLDATASASWVDSFSPLSSSASAFSLKSAGDPSARAVSPQPRTPSRKTPADSNAGGFKSMWAQFSTNASAALNAVQDVYEGAKKDFVVPALPGAFSGGASSSTTDGELLEKPNASTSAGARKWTDIVEEPSPWASYSRPPSSIPTDNPWAASTSSSRGRAPGGETIEADPIVSSGSATQSRVGAASVLSDPQNDTRSSTVAPAITHDPLPESLEALTLSSDATLRTKPFSPPPTPQHAEKPTTASSSSLPNRQPPQPPQPPQSQQSDSGPPFDPLGVGLV